MKLRWTRIAAAAVSTTLGAAMWLTFDWGWLEVAIAANVCVAMVVLAFWREG